MIRGAQRVATLGDRRGFMRSGTDGHDSAAQRYNEELILMGFNPRDHAVGPRGSFAYRAMTRIPLDGGGVQDVATSRFWNTRIPEERWQAIQEAGAALRKPGLIDTNRTMNIRGMRSSTTVATRGAGLVNFNTGVGGNILGHGPINIGRGVRNSTVTLDTYDHHNMTVAGGINLRLRGNVMMDGAYIPGAIRVLSGEASMAGVRGNPTINGMRYSAVAHAAARHATDEVFDPTHGTGSFNMPSHAAIMHATRATARLGTRPAVSNHLSREAIRHVLAEAQAHYGASHVRNKKLEEPHPV